MERGGVVIVRLRGCQLNSSSASSVWCSKTRSFVLFRILLFSFFLLDASVKGICVIMLQIIINWCNCQYLITIDLAVILMLFTPCNEMWFISQVQQITCAIHLHYISQLLHVSAVNCHFQGAKPTFKTQWIMTQYAALKYFYRSKIVHVIILYTSII